MKTGSSQPKVKKQVHREVATGQEDLGQNTTYSCVLHGHFKFCLPFSLVFADVHMRMHVCEGRNATSALINFRSDHQEGCLLPLKQRLS